MIEGLSHITFIVKVYAARIRSLGIDVRKGRNRIEGEGDSLYFYDFDNHLFELHTGTLAQRLVCYKSNRH